MKITSVTYSKTKEGVAYTCDTNIKGIKVVNDGVGGATYIDGAFQNIKLNKNYTEDELEDLINEFEAKKYKC